MKRGVAVLGRNRIRIKRGGMILCNGKRGSTNVLAQRMNIQSELKSSKKKMTEDIHEGREEGRVGHEEGRVGHEEFRKFGESSNG